MEGQRKGPGTSRNVNVMVMLHVISVDMIETLKTKFMSLRVVQFLNHLIMLKND